MDMFWQAALENQLLLPKLRTDSLQLAQVLLPSHGQEQLRCFTNSHGSQEPQLLVDVE